MTIEELRRQLRARLEPEPWNHGEIPWEIRPPGPFGTPPEIHRIAKDMGALVRGTDGVFRPKEKP